MTEKKVFAIDTDVFVCVWLPESDFPEDDDLTDMYINRIHNQIGTLFTNVNVHVMVTGEATSPLVFCSHFPAREAVLGLMTRALGRRDVDIC